MTTKIERSENLTNMATIGYVLKALKTIMSESDIEDIISKLYYYFDVMTVEEAEEYYMSNC